MQLQFLKAFALQMTGKPNEAAAYYDKYIVKNPRADQAWFNLACLYMASGKLDKAI